MLKWSLCDYSDKYILVKGTVSFTAAAAGRGNVNEKVIFKSCALFTDCISKINNAQEDNDKDIDAVMAMYNLIEYSVNYSKTSVNLWQYDRDEPAFADAGVIANFPGNSVSLNLNKI